MQLNFAHTFGHFLSQLVRVQSTTHEVSSFVQQGLLRPVLYPIDLTVAYHIAVIAQNGGVDLAVGTQRQTNVQVALHTVVEELLRVQDHVGKLSFDAWTDGMVQAVHFIVAKQMKAFAIVQ